MDIKRFADKNKRIKRHLKLWELIRFGLANIYPMPTNGTYNFIAYLSNSKIKYYMVKWYLDDIDFFNKINDFVEIPKNVLLKC